MSDHGPCTFISCSICGPELAKKGFQPRPTYDELLARTDAAEQTLIVAAETQLRLAIILGAKDGESVVVAAERMRNELDKQREEYATWIEELEGPTPKELLDQLAAMKLDLDAARVAREIDRNLMQIELNTNRESLVLMHSSIRYVIDRLMQTYTVMNDPVMYTNCTEIIRRIDGLVKQ